MTKKCTTAANEESYQILSGTTVLKTSSAFVDKEQRTDEYCLVATTNHQYLFKIVDSYGDSWSAGAWVSVAGLYGNMVLKTMMVDNHEEEYLLSLYYPIVKSAEWKMYVSASTIDPNWNSLGYDDHTWNSLTLGSIPSSVSGTQYFRKTFTGLPNMAAYEVEMNYQYGIVAYVNGMEIFRDHMADGAVSPSTSSSGGFNDYEYHGFIRPAKEVEASSVLAVELHFPTADKFKVLFDAYVALLGSSTPVTDTDKCFVYPYAVTLTATGGYDPRLAFDFDKTSYFHAPDDSLPVSVTYELAGPRMHVNALRVWPYTFTTNAPGSFTLAGAMSTSGTYSNVIAAHGSYRSSQYKLFFGHLNARAYQTYRLTISSAASAATVYGVEVQPVTCADMAPSRIEFVPDSFTAFTRVSVLDIRPTNQEFSNCTLTPALPAGLIFNAATCSITGKPAVDVNSTVFTMRATLGGQSYEGSFTLESTGCSATLVQVLRTYRAKAFMETFSIKDLTTQEVVLSVTPDSGQPPMEDWWVYLCLPSPRYEISVGCTDIAWSQLSRLFVNVMLSEDEFATVARMRYDSYEGFAEDRIVNVQWSVAPQSQWFYKMNEVPANWFGSETAGWSTGSMGGFSGATNQIQLYKKTFSVGSLNDVAGFVISLRYLYGCVIYLNGVEAFRNGVEGNLTTSSLSTNAYNDLMYRQISLPKRTIASGETPAVNYLVEGSNTIAIAIVAQTASQTTSYFDCTLRLMGDVANSRVFDYTVSYSSFDWGYPKDLADLHYANSIGMDSCADNYWTISFNNDRREWISSVDAFLCWDQTKYQPAQFTLKARNSNLEAWTTLRTVTGMTWSLKGEHKTLWLDSNKSWNQFRFENIGTGDESSCLWRFGGFNLFTGLFPTDIPDLSYPLPIVITVTVEMGEVYPNSEFYYDFSVSPALPAGIKLDRITGKISGKCRTATPSDVYQITAKKVGAGNVTVSITLSVEPCFGDKHLITMVARLDSWPSRSSYKLFSGKGTSGEVVASVPEFKVKNGLNYGDFCVANNIYTLVVYDSKKDGWSNPAGWYLTIDVGEMVFEMGQMPVGVASVSTMFSSLLPFQVEYDEWKVWNKEEAVSGDWKSVEFDDAGWETKKAAEFGNHVGTTAYVRREVTIPAIEDYHVLNVRMKYAGGVVAYFNGVKVARFNLEENYDASSEALMVHDASLFSKFHVVLSTVGAVSGKNMISFEIHRAPGESGVVFDASGVFGVNDCSIVVDSFSSIDASEVSGCRKEELLDLNPTTFGHIVNVAGSFLSWTVDNLEGSKANTFALQTSNAVTGYGFSVYGRWEASDEYTSALAVTEQTTKDRERNTWSMPVGIAGFTELRFEVDSPASDDVSVNAYALVYCKPSGSGSCAGIDDYPAVGEGEISPVRCPTGFRGYSYRMCTNGVLGEVHNEKCEYRVPANLEYVNNNMEFVLGAEASSGKPTYKNIIELFYVQDDIPLPEGISLDARTGVIAGIPLATMDAKAFTVRGKNPRGEVIVAITITVRTGYCPPDGVFDRTPVGEIAVYQCARKGNFVGTLRRGCILGKKDGEWQKATGLCISVFNMIVIVVVAIIVVGMFAVILSRTRKVKPVGGVRGRGAGVKRGPTMSSANAALL